MVIIRKHFLSPPTTSFLKMHGSLHLFVFIWNGTTTKLFSVIEVAKFAIGVCSRFIIKKRRHKGLTLLSMAVLNLSRG